MRTAAAAAAIVAALALQTTLAWVVIRGTAAIDLVLIVVVYIALKSGPVAGLIGGTAAGLIQDALSNPILGIGGLAKTIVGFLSGVLATQFILNGPLPRLVLLVMATFLHAAIFMGLYVLLDLRQFPDPLPSVVGQALGNGFVGVVGFQLVEWLPGCWGRVLRRYRLDGVDVADVLGKGGTVLEGIQITPVRAQTTVFGGVRETWR